MINPVAKGRRNQRRAAEKLRSEGWQVYSSRRGYKGQPIDIFGLFDHVCYKDGYFLFVQVKSNYCSKAVRDKIRAFVTDGVFVMREIWVYKDWDRKSPYIKIIR